MNQQNNPHPGQAPVPAPPEAGLDYLANLQNNQGTTNVEPQLFIDQAAEEYVYTTPTSASRLRFRVSPCPPHHRDYGTTTVVETLGNVKSDAITVVLEVRIESLEKLAESIDIAQATNFFGILTKKDAVKVGDSFARILRISDSDFICAHATISIDGEEGAVSSAAKEKYFSTGGNFNCNHPEAASTGLFSVCKPVGEKLIKDKIAGSTGACENFDLDIRQVQAHDVVPELENNALELYGFYMKIRTRSGIKSFMVSTTSDNPFDTLSWNGVIPWQDIELEGVPILVPDRPSEDSFLTSVGVNIN